MRDGLLPSAMLCVALALALGFVPTRIWGIAVAALLFGCAAALLLPVTPDHADAIFLGCWVSTVVLAGCVHLPRGMNRATAVVLGLNAGVWACLVARVGGGAANLLVAVPLVLLCVPARWLALTGRGIALKVAASWLLAIGVMEMVLMLTPTPGYKPDHME